MEGNVQQDVSHSAWKNTNQVMKKYSTAAVAMAKPCNSAGIVSSEQNQCPNQNDGHFLTEMIGQ